MQEENVKLFGKPKLKPDAHCHLIDYQFPEQLDQVLEKAKAAGIVGIVENATKAENFDRVREIKEKYPDLVYHSYGYHPYYLESIEENWEEL